MRNIADGVVSEVCNVESEEEGGQDSALGDNHAAVDHVRYALPGSHKLWPVREVVEDPWCQLMVQSCSFKLASQKHQLDGVEVQKPGADAVWSACLLCL